MLDRIVKTLFTEQEREDSNPLLLEAMSIAIVGEANKAGVVDPTLVLDLFTDTNGVGLDAHTPDTDTAGNGWVEDSGTWEIDGNEVKETTGTNRYATIDVGDSDVTIYATRTDSASSDPGIVARFTDVNNHYLFVLNSITNVLQLWKKVGGSWTQLGTSVAHTYSSGEVLKLTLSGTSLKGYVDDVLKIDETDGAHGAINKHGLFIHAGNYSAVRWDTFTIETV